MKKYAIFFPQYHQVEVNDEAWGYGFTDWVLVGAANAFDYWKRRFPACGAYDLSNLEHVRERLACAADAGIDGFGIYHYRFDDGPEIDSVERYLGLMSPPSQFKYFFIWANENWSRRWAGKNTEILKTVSDRPTRKDIAAHVNYLAPYIESRAYTRVDGRPLFVIYRPDVFTDVSATDDLYRQEFLRAGISISLGYFLKNVTDAAYSRLFDFGYLFEPRMFFNFSGIRRNKLATRLFKKAIGLLPESMAEMFSELATRALNRGSRTYSFRSFLEYFRSSERQALINVLQCRFQNVVTCGWNNAPRYRTRFTQLELPTADEFTAMLEAATRDTNCWSELPLLCNAWNEWSEGAAIEPCIYLGDSLLTQYIGQKANCIDVADEVTA